MIRLLRHFSIRARMCGAIALVLTLLGMVGACGLVGMFRIQASSEAFIGSAFRTGQTLAALQAALGEAQRQGQQVFVRYEKMDSLEESSQQWEAAASQALGLVGELKHPELQQALKTWHDGFADTLQKMKSGAIGSATAGREASEPALQALATAEQALSNLNARLRKEADSAHAEQRSVAHSTVFWFGLTVALAVTVVAPLTLLNMVSIQRPLQQAEGLAAAIASGDLRTPVRHEGRDEVTHLLASLASMQQSLQQTVGRVRDSAGIIRQSSGEIASGNLDLSQRTELSASRLQQTAASMEQLTGTVQASAEAAAQANQLAGTAASVAQRGGAMVAQVVATMDDINTSSKKISEIIGVIDGIAFQTNILALNAAVEAARAGEQGRGFAVVAGEVRALAQRSAEAARQIKTLVGASVDRVESGARLVQDAGSTMGEIVSSVQRVSEIIAAITRSSGEQSGGIGQMNHAVSQLDQMTQQNAALVEESAAAAESLSQQALALTEVVGTFKLAN